MIGFCKSPPLAWFTSIKENDISYVQKSFTRFVRSRDTRETCVAEEIFKGFTGAMYAVYFNHLEILQLLLQQEIDYQTDELITIPTPGIGAGTTYKVQPATNLLSLALLRGSGKAVRFIMRFLVESDSFSRVNNADVNGLTSLHFAAICNFQDAVLVLKNEKLLKTLFTKAAKGDFSLLFTAAYFGRPLVVQCLIELVKRGMYVGNIRKMFEATDSQGQTVQQLASVMIRYDKLGSSFELKDESGKLIEELGRQLAAVQTSLSKDVGTFI